MEIRKIMEIFMIGSTRIQEESIDRVLSRTSALIKNLIRVNYEEVNFFLLSEEKNKRKGSQNSNRENELVGEERRKEN